MVVCEPDGTVCEWCSGEGMVCEDHPDRPAGHDGCTGAGMPCENPECPYWKAEPGERPPAMRFDVTYATTDSGPSPRGRRRVRES